MLLRRTYGRRLTEMPAQRVHGSPRCPLVPCQLKMPAPSTSWFCPTRPTFGEVSPTLPQMQFRLEQARDA